MFLRHRLSKEGVHPIGAPNLSRFRLVELFTACTQATVKDRILQAFSNPNRILRIVVATVAFGVGLDCPNVRRVIHWGASSDIEAYLQETGRAGKDGQPSEALLYATSSFANRFLEESMKEYVKNKEICRRAMLLKDFDGDVDFCISCSGCECTCQSCISAVTVT